MSETIKHTPGPWVIARGYNGKLTVGNDPSGYIPLHTPWQEDAFDNPRDPKFHEANANMRLIAKAPELYAMCQRLRELAYSFGSEECQRDLDALLKD